MFPLFLLLAIALVGAVRSVTVTMIKARTERQRIFSDAVCTVLRRLP